LTVLVPARLCAAVGRDLKLSARSRKRLDVNLEPARFVGLVGDPLAVGGELAIAFVKRSFQERKRLFIAEHRQNPQVSARLRAAVTEQQKASIGGPVEWRFVLI